MKPTTQIGFCKLKTVFVRDRWRGMLFTMDLLITVAVFVVLVVWSVCGFGGDTLVEKLIRRFNISFKTAALLVSVVVGLSGTFLVLEADVCKRKRRQVNTGSRIML